MTYCPQAAYFPTQAFLMRVAPNHEGLNWMLAEGLRYVLVLEVTRGSSSKMFDRAGMKWGGKTSAGLGNSIAKLLYLYTTEHMTHPNHTCRRVGIHEVRKTF